MVAMRHFLSCFGLMSLCLGISSCITPSEKRVMKDDIYSVQMRLLNLERLLADTSKDAKNSGESATKRIASTQAELERMSRELQVVHGEIDALKVGVTTGQLPGADASTQEHSVARNLTKLTERIGAVESAQEDLIEALKKAGVKGGKKKDPRKTATDVAELQKAFDEKHFKQVLEEGSKLPKPASGDEQEQLQFLLAESQFRLGNIKDAALKFNDFVDSKPSPKYLGTAKLRLGDCFRHLGDVATSNVFYEELIKEFPSSDEAAKARERLAEGSGDKK